MDFVAFDFETANERRCSPCALGIVVVRSGQPVERFSCLIRPPELRFTPFNVAIHGIRPADVVGQPEFAGWWPTIRKHFDGQLLLAHNASFDVSVLTRTLDVYGIECPDFRYACTCGIAKAVWPGQPTYNLKAVAALLGLTFVHHNALEDAEACANVALCAAGKTGATSAEELCALAEAGRRNSGRARATRRPRRVFFGLSARPVSRRNAAGWCPVRTVLRLHRSDGLDET
jgi:DNA polymerase III subunit epsilon